MEPVALQWKVGAARLCAERPGSPGWLSLYCAIQPGTHQQVPSQDQTVGVRSPRDLGLDSNGAPQ
jgi:hypothetical protein